MMLRTLAVCVTLLSLIGPTARAQEKPPPMKLSSKVRLLFEAAWQERQSQFTETLKTLNLDPDVTVSDGPPAIRAATAQVVAEPLSQVQMHLAVPVKRANIRGIKASVQEKFPKSPWWPCPFSLAQQISQCGQIPPVNSIHPGGVAFLQYTVKDLDDGTTMVETGVFNWAEAPYARNARLEVDYQVP
jgi:hypothetical protein